MNNVRFLMQADQRLTKSILNLRHRQNVNTSESLLHLIRIGLSPKHNCTFFTKTQQYSSSASNNVSSRRRVLSKKKKPLLSGPQITAIGCGLFTLAAASLPYYMLQSTKPLHQREDALNATEIRRGPYVNSGSRDVGIDPNWDFKTGTRIRSNDLNDHDTSSPYKN